jgi:small basic protein (TIGR04137 family)
LAAFIAEPIRYLAGCALVQIRKTIAQRAFQQEPIDAAARNQTKTEDEQCRHGQAEFRVRHARLLRKSRNVFHLKNRTRSVTYRLIFAQHREQSMSQHRSLKGASTITAKRNVLKRFERVELLKKRGQWKEGTRVIGLPKTKPDV